MNETCDFCVQRDGHLPLCPMTYILADSNREAAYDMGVPVCTSDWIDAALMRQVFGESVRHALIESWMLLTQYHDRLRDTAVQQAIRETEALVLAEMQAADL